MLSGGPSATTFPPESIVKNPHSYTGKYLKDILQPKEKGD
jgi:hypothetical protein